MDTKISRTNLHVTADIEVDQTVGFPVLRPEEDQTIRITGRVVQARTGTGLPGLRVVALAATGSEAVLGSGVSNPDGWCQIGFDDCPETVVNCPDSPYYGPMPGNPEIYGYNLVAAFGDCTNYGSSAVAGGVLIQATTDTGCISEEEMVGTLCGE